MCVYITIAHNLRLCVVMFDDAMTLTLTLTSLQHHQSHRTQLPAAHHPRTEGAAAS